MSNFRCTICNKVSSKDIETDIGDFFGNYFIPDHLDKSKTICGQCQEVHYSLMQDYFYLDDPYGWEEEGILDQIDIKEESSKRLTSTPSNDNRDARITDK